MKGESKKEERTELQEEEEEEEEEEERQSRTCVPYFPWSFDIYHWQIALLSSR